MLIQTIQRTVNSSLKQGDTATVETLRFLVAAIQTYAIHLYGREADSKLSDEDVLSVIRKQVKMHQESIEIFEKAGRTELAEKEKKQLRILEQYLPKELSDEELRRILMSVIQESGTVSDTKVGFGPIMGKAMSALAGRASGSRVSTMLKQLVQ